MYPLYVVPLSLAFPDGTKRQSQKCKLLDILQFESTYMEKRADILIIDMIAQYRSISTNPPNTFEDLVKRFLQSILSRYVRINVIADCYRDRSIKSEEREKRGTSRKIIVGSIKSKVPRDMSKFFANGENKLQLITLTFSFIRENQETSFQILNCEEIILSGDCVCQKITPYSSENCGRLRSDQEEADTKVILHAMDALELSNSNVCVRSPSGDTDILVIALSLIEEKDRILLDNGNGDNKKKVWLDEVTQVDYHAFTWE